MPIGAVVWILLWAPVIATGSARLDRASVIAVAGSILVLAHFWQWMIRHDPFLAAFGALATIAVGLAVPTMNGARWWSRGSLCGIVPLILHLPPFSFSFWPFWTGKIRITAITSVTPWIATILAVLLGIALQWRGRRLLLKSVTGQLDLLAERATSTVMLWIGPFIDTIAVLWIAAERFLWQGLTLWLPRRILQWVGIYVDWLQRAPLPSLRHVPLDIMVMGGAIVRGLTGSSRAIVVLLAAFLIVVWVSAGVIP